MPFTWTKSADISISMQNSSDGHDDDGQKGEIMPPSGMTKH